MSTPAFFRLTARAIVATLFVTGIAVASIIYTFSCALDGTGECIQIPQVVQMIIIALLLPWIAVARFIGQEYLGIGAVLGIGLSLVWVFLIVCVIRWVATKVTTKRQKVENSI